MSFDQTTFRFIIPMTHAQAEEAAELVKQYDRALKEGGELTWGNGGLQDCFGLGSASCLTAKVMGEGLQITWDTDADLEVAKTMTESLLDRFDIDEPVVFRYGKATGHGEASSGGTILAHRDPSKSQWSSAHDLEELMMAGLNVDRLLAELRLMARVGEKVINPIAASTVLRAIAERTTETEHRRSKAIKSGAQTEKDVEEVGNAITLGFEYWEERTEAADSDIEIARELLGVEVEVEPIPEETPGNPTP